MSKLVNIIRELVREELFNEENFKGKGGRLSKGLVIADPEKAKKLKQLYPESNWIHKMIVAIEDTEGMGLTRLGYKDPQTGEFIEGLSQILDMRHTYINPQIAELILNGVLRDTEGTAVPKKEKPESTGARGRKTSEKSREGVVRTLFAKFQEDPNFEPSEEDLTYNLPKGLGTEKLSPELLAKTKAKALGTVKRGRPATKSTDDLLSKVKQELSEAKQLHKVFRRMHEK